MSDSEYSFDGMDIDSDYDEEQSTTTTTTTTTPSTTTTTTTTNTKTKKIRKRPKKPMTKAQMDLQEEWLSKGGCPITSNQYIRKRKEDGVLICITRGLETQTKKQRTKDGLNRSVLEAEYGRKAAPGFFLMRIKGVVTQVPNRNIRLKKQRDPDAARALFIRATKLEALAKQMKQEALFIDPTLDVEGIILDLEILDSGVFDFEDIDFKMQAANIFTGVDSVEI